MNPERSMAIQKQMAADEAAKAEATQAQPVPEVDERGAKELEFLDVEAEHDNEKLKKELAKTMSPAIDCVLEERGHQPSPGASGDEDSFIDFYVMKSEIQRYATDRNTVDPAVLQQVGKTDQKNLGRSVAELQTFQEKTRQLEIQGGAREIKAEVEKLKKSEKAVKKSVIKTREIQKEHQRVVDAAQKTMEVRDILPEIEYKMEIHGRVGRKDELETTNLTYVEPLLKTELPDNDRKKIEEWRDANQAKIDEIAQWFEDQGPETLRYAYLISNENIDQKLWILGAEEDAEKVKENAGSQDTPRRINRSKREEILISKKALLQMREHNTAKIKESEAEITASERLHSTEGGAEDTVADWMEAYTSTAEQTSQKKQKTWKKTADALARKTTRAERQKAQWMNRFVEDRMQAKHDAATQKKNTDTARGKTRSRRVATQ